MNVRSSISRGTQLKVGLKQRMKGPDHQEPTEASIDW